jgi:hypothetical protein
LVATSDLGSDALVAWGFESLHPYHYFDDTPKSVLRLVGRHKPNPTGVSPK